MFHRVSKTTISALVAAFLVGCQGDPYYHLYARSRPAPKDVSGLWHLDLAASHGGPKVVSATPNTLEFLSDGKAVLRNTPDAMNIDHRIVKGGLESGSGTWKIEQDEDIWVIEVHLSEINGTGPGQFRRLNIVGHSSPYKLHAVLGDPDNGDCLVFRKDEGGK